MGNSILRLNNISDCTPVKKIRNTKLYIYHTHKTYKILKEKIFFWLKIVYKKKKILKTNKKIWIKLWCCRKNCFLALSNFTYAIKMKIYSIYKKRREGDSVRLISNINYAAKIENSHCSCSDSFPPQMKDARHF